MTRENVLGHGSKYCVFWLWCMHPSKFFELHILNGCHLLHVNYTSIKFIKKWSRGKTRGENNHKLKGQWLSGVSNESPHSTGSKIEMDLVLSFGKHYSTSRFKTEVFLLPLKCLYVQLYSIGLGYLFYYFLLRNFLHKSLLLRGSRLFQTCKWL